MLERSSLILVSISLAAALVAGEAQARGCNGPRAVSEYQFLSDPEHSGTPNTEAEQARRELEKKIDKMHANDGNPSMLYVVLPKQKGQSESEILRIPYPEGEHMEITKAQLDVLQKYPEVKVFNKSKNSSVYFLPYTERGLKGAIPQYDFRSARLHDRWAGEGCNIISFQMKNVSYFSAVSGSLATWGDKISDTQKFSVGAKKVMTKPHADLYKESLDVLLKKFKDIKVSGRGPAVENASPYGEKVDARLDKLLKANPKAFINFGADGMPYVQKTAGAK